LLNTRPVIFDVGAYSGEFSFLATDVYAEQGALIYAFEPSLRNYQRLKQAIELAVEHPGVSIEPHSLALGRQSGREQLYLKATGASTGSRYRPTREATSALVQEDITVETIDSFCNDHAITRIDYLKLDVEGSELDVLLGATEVLARDAIRFIQFEFGEKNIESRVFLKDFFDLLGSKYRFYRIVRNGLRRINRYSSELEVFATANYLAEHIDAS
jgi:FkbM family methyltransferase